MNEPLLYQPYESFVISTQRFVVPLSSLFPYVRIYLATSKVNSNELVLGFFILKSRRGCDV